MFAQRTTAKIGQYSDHVGFRYATGCRGRVEKRGDTQGIGLAPGCGHGATVREIGHAFGLWRERTRDDRGTIVRTNWQSTPAGTEHNFNHQFIEVDDVGADGYVSTTPGGSHAVSKNGCFTIKPIPAV